MAAAFRDLFPAHHWARSKALYSLTTFIVIICFIGFTTLVSDSDSRPHDLGIPEPPPISPPASGADNFVTKQVFAQPKEIAVVQKPKTPGPFSTTRKATSDPEPVHLKGVKSRYAIATFLVGTEKNLNYEEDRYFIATRTLAYQLLHAPETRSRDRSIPFIVAVSSFVGQKQRERLRADGAIVVELPPLTADWLAVGIPEWEHVMTKLRLWELVDFERIAFVDADTILTKPLDGIFDDPAVQEQPTLKLDIETLDGATPLPKTYVFGGNAENTGGHEFPPTENHRDWINMDYLNAGFFVFQPSIEMLNHYVSILKIPKSFESNMPEQGLLNFIHRREANMPWKQLNSTWNIHYPNINDVKKGAVSIHEKWWHPEPGELRLYMESWRWRMEGFYQALDLKEEK